MGVLKMLVPAFSLVLAGTAQAHVVIQPRTVPSGYQVLRFVVGHGCDGKATTRLTINIPPVVHVARPQPKPGWKLDMERWAERPGEVSVVSWTGRLPADQFEEFLLLVKLPESRGLAFPTVQSCGNTHVPWTGSDPAHPAPTVEAAPSTSPESGHDHHR